MPVCAAFPTRSSPVRAAFPTASNPDSAACPTSETVSVAAFPTSLTAPPRSSRTFTATPPGRCPPLHPMVAILTERDHRRQGSHHPYRNPAPPPVKCASAALLQRFEHGSGLRPGVGRAEPGVEHHARDGEVGLGVEHHHPAVRLLRVGGG